MTHAVNRTSPKGEPFEGTCSKCGQSGLPLSALHDPCPNDGQVPDDIDATWEDGVPPANAGSDPTPQQVRDRIFAEVPPPGTPDCSCGKPAALQFSFQRNHEATAEAHEVCTVCAQSLWDGLGKYNHVLPDHGGIFRCIDTVTLLPLVHAIPVFGTLSGIELEEFVDG